MVMFAYCRGCVVPDDVIMSVLFFLGGGAYCGPR